MRRFGVWGLGFGVWGLGFVVWGLGVWGLGFCNSWIHVFVFCGLTQHDQFKHQRRGTGGVQHTYQHTATCGECVQVGCGCGCVGIGGVGDMSDRGLDK